uniref:SP-RING-type domain-containing protein n=1 Tax=Ascaris lumbricoides TaxID=6252 RepID=A0A0M3HXT0_ASCLU
MMVVASTMQQQQHQIQSSQPQTSPQHCNGQSTLEREDDSEGQETTSGSPPSTSAVSASGRIGNAAGVSHGSEDTRQDTVPSRTMSDQSVSAVNDKNGQHGQPCNAAGVEVSVVGSPEVFGHHTPATTTPESDDERTIERFDLLNQSADSLCLPTSDPRPPKKRFMQMADLPRTWPLHQQPSAFVEPHKSIFVPSGEQFQEAMNRWDWYKVDGFSMPVVLRANESYAAVHIVQLKLLSKFPPNIPPEMTSKFTMVSHKMTPIEACIFNSVNAVITKFDLGCYLFTLNDEIVRVDDVERFYWSVKEWNMRNMIERYNAELRVTSSTHLMAVITKIKNTVQDILQASKLEFIFCISISRFQVVCISTNTTNISTRPH